MFFIYFVYKYFIEFKIMEPFSIILIGIGASTFLSQTISVTNMISKSNKKKPVKKSNNLKFIDV